MPPRRPNRHHQLGELIRAEMSDFLRLEMRDPRVELVSITEVEVTPDLKHARIYFSRLGSDAERAETLKALRHATPYLRRLLAPRLTIRSVPVIEFRLDGSLVQGDQIMRLLNQLPELQPEAQSAPGQPEAQSAPGQPEAQSAPGQPEAQSAPGQPEAQSAPPPSESQGAPLPMPVKATATARKRTRS